MWIFLIKEDHVNHSMLEESLLERLLERLRGGGRGGFIFFFWSRGGLSKVLYDVVKKISSAPPPPCSIHNECSLIIGYGVHTVLVKFSTVPTKTLTSTLAFRLLNG